jgi:hypothetical protein
MKLPRWEANGGDVRMWRPDVRVFKAFSCDYHLQLFKYYQTFQRIQHASGIKQHLRPWLRSCTSSPGL